MHKLMNLGLQPPDSCFRKRLVYRTSTNSVKFVLSGAEPRVYQCTSCRVEVMLLLIAYTAPTGVNLLDEFRIAAMKLFWIDPDNRSYSTTYWVSSMSSTGFSFTQTALWTLPYISCNRWISVVYRPQSTASNQNS